MRSKKFLKLVKQGYTYQEIGDMYNVSKTIVYLNLKKHFPEETEKALKKIGWRKGKRPTPRAKVTIRCKQCGKKRKTKYRYYKPAFCSSECRSKFLRNVWKNNK